ncbi:hypothetical protein F4V43_09565 [Paenibacillus spiritus]|uniref:CRISPR type III-associated protein domain-containing protein n=1 Tax=Paenibacillus spiritus TaxID=2496557 RepID=A0A5J5GA83_9BACL|nr:RAMP superfamily CRISPR-associated protein [Paenibacillus spiritus]KAA9004870.1 hypothetical protein F4V43_09565 [Paenibacillus spiritus]
MNIRQRFVFNLIAKGPVHFGGESPGDILTDEGGRPFVSGNSIGGALRNFLKCSGNIPNKDILCYLGGDEKYPPDSDKPADFIESRAFIGDGRLTPTEEWSELIVGNDPFPAMEGTAIEAGTGTARPNHKYKRYYLPAGTKLCFEVECDAVLKEAKKPEEASVPESEISFTQLVYILAAAIESGELRFGGQKSNGYGRFAVEGLTRHDFIFDNPMALDDYVWNRRANEGCECREDALNNNLYSSPRSPVVLSLKGSFPYAVYQAYSGPTNARVLSAKATRLQQNINGNYYLPGSSVKGLLRHELRRLLLRMLRVDADDSERERAAEVLVQEWFGSQEKPGSIVVEDVVIDKAQEIKIKRPYSQKRQNEEQDANDFPKYIRIDRITGGVIDGALKTQNEVHGEAEVRLELRDAADVEAKLFPLVYVLRRVGSGLIPLGGRTAIGLGEFHATATEIDLYGDKLCFRNDDMLPEDEESVLKFYYDQFVKYIESLGGAGNDDARF